MRKLLAIGLVLIFGSAWAQTDYNKVSGDNKDQWARVIAKAKDRKAVIYAGTTEGDGATGKDILVYLTDYDGNGMLKKRIGGSGDEEALGVVCAKDSNFYVVGYTTSVSGDKDAFITKLSYNNLDIVWQKTFGGTGDDEFLDITEHNYDYDPARPTLIMAGYTTTIKGKDILYYDIDFDGNVMGNRVFGGDGDDVAVGIDTTDQSDMAIAGWTNSFSETKDLFVYYTDYDGSMLSADIYDSGEDDVANGMFYYSNESSLAGVYIAGYQKLGDGFKKGLHVGIYRNGTINYQRSFKSDFGDVEFFRIDGYSGGVGPLAAGYTTSENGDKNGVQLFTDWSGNNEGSLLLGECGGDEVLYDFMEVFTEGVSSLNVMAGFTSTYGKGGKDVMCNSKRKVWGVIDECIRTSYYTQGDYLTCTQKQETIPSQKANITETTTNFTAVSIDRISQEICDITATNCQTEIQYIDQLQLCGSGAADLKVPFGCGNALWSTGSTDSTISVNSDGQYSVIVTKADGCVAHDTIQVKFNTTPVVVNLPDTTLFCDTIKIDAGAGFDEYKWNTGFTGQVLEVSKAGVYSVKARKNACWGKDSTLVTRSILPNYHSKEYYYWEATEENLDFTWSGLDSTKLYVLRVSGGFNDNVAANNGNTYLDALFTFDRASNDSVALNNSPEGYWFIKDNKNIIPSDYQYSDCHSYDFTFCGQDTSIHIYYVDALYANNAGGVTFELFESDFALPIAFGGTGEPEIVFEGACIGENTSFAVQNFYAESYNWDFGDPLSGQNSSTIETPNHLFSASDTFYVTLSGKNYCSKQDTVRSTIVLGNKATVDVKNVTACDTAYVVLESGIDTSLFDVRWSTGDSLPDLNVYGTEDIILSVSDASCVVTDTIEVVLSNIVLSGQSKYWYFGTGAGLHFSDTGTYAIAGPFNTEEGMALIADVEGSIKAYASAGKVFNKNFEQMPNATGLKNHNSSTQGAVFVPNPANTSQYYLFATSSIEAGEFGVYQYMIDFSLDSGRGDLVQENQGIVLPSSENVQEKITAIKHPTKNAYWLATYNLETPSAIGSSLVLYLIDENGVHLHSIIPFDFAINDAQGQLKFSADGTKIAVGILLQNKIQLFDFNAETGEIKLKIELASSSPYGIEFSPNGKILYASSYYGKLLIQFDLSLDSNLISAYQYLLPSDKSAFRTGVLQLAPDGKIYIVSYGTGTLGVIEHPDVLGADMDYQATGLSLVSGTSGKLGLPTILQSSVSNTAGNFSFNDICLGEQVLLNVNATGYTSLTWSLSDGTVLNDVNRVNHQFATAGKKEITVSLHNACGGSMVLKDTIDVHDVPTFSIPDLSICDDSAVYSVDSTVFSNIQWSNGDTTGSTTFYETAQVVVQATYDQCALSDTANLELNGVKIKSRATKTWYFGSGAGLVFGENSIERLSNDYGKLSSKGDEGTALIENTRGEVVAYAYDGTIYNKLGERMKNAENLMFDLSSTEGGLFVPVIGEKNKYYFFSVPSLESRKYGVYQYIVDLSQDNGKGAVELSSKGLVLPSSNGVQEKITAYKHPTQNSYWLLAFSTTNNTYLVYTIDSTGVKLHDQFVSTLSGYGPQGEFKLSSQGNYLASVMYAANAVHYMKFDPLLGKISDIKSLTPGSLPYGVEFSPNEEFLYVSLITNKSVLQFEIAKDGSINPSTVVSFTNSSDFVNSGALQLAPNGKIYSTGTNGKALDVINNPNEKGTAANFVKGHLTLAAGTVGKLGFPTLIQSDVQYKNSILESDDVCTGTPVHAQVYADDFVSVEWKFSDGQIFNDTLSLEFLPTKTGLNTVEVVLKDECGGEVKLQDTIYVREAPKLDIPDTVLCNQDLMLQVNDSKIDSLRWSISPNLVSNEATYKYSGKEWVEAQNEFCTIVDSFDVTIDGRTKWEGTENERLNHWLFGNRIQLDFSDDTIVSVPNTRVFSFAPSLGVTKTGELLFSSDGSNVYNAKTGAVIKDGSNLGAYVSLGQPVLVIPYQNDDTKFYVFTTSQIYGLQYSIVDMSAEGGNGAVISKGNTLYANSATQMTSYQNADGSYWLVTADKTNGNWLSFKVTDTSIDPIPVVSNNINSAWHTNGGQMTFNFQGNKIAAAGNNSGILTLAEFDLATGTASNPINIPLLSSIGVQFSPTSDKLYFSAQGNSAYSGFNYFDISSWDANTIAISRTNMYKVNYAGHIQYAKNGKLYMSASGAFYLYSIDDLYATTPVFNEKALYLEGKQAYYGLPTFPISDLYQTNMIRANDVCLGEKVNAKVLGIESTSISWNWGDLETEIGSDTSSHLYSKAGEYTIRISTSSKCGGTSSLETKVNVHNQINASLSDSSICGAKYIEVDAGQFEGATYQWSNGSTNSTLLLTNSDSVSVLISYPGACLDSAKAYYEITGGSAISYDKWQFGDNAAIDFTKGTASVGVGGTGTGNMISIITLKGKSFAFDGANLYDSQGTIVLSGFLGNTNGTQPALMIAPDPDKDSLMLFYVANTGYLYYSIVDVSTNTPKIVRANTYLSPYASPRITAYQSQNKTYLAIRINGTQVQLYEIGKDFSIGTNQTIAGFSYYSASTGVIQFSSDGSKMLVINENNSVEIYSFDPSIGKMLLYDAWLENDIKGATFSADGTKIYVTKPSARQIVQYDLSLPVGQIQSNRKVIVDRESFPISSTPSHMQLASDGNIYISHNDDGETNTLSVLKGTSNPVFEYGTVKLSGPTTINGGLVSYPAGTSLELKPTLIYENACLGDTSIIEVINTNSFVTFMYDEAEIDLLERGEQKIKVIYKDSGTKAISTSMLEMVCGSSKELVLTGSLEVIEAPEVHVPDSTVCGESFIEIKLMDNGYDSIIWSNDRKGLTGIFEFSKNYSVDVYKGKCKTTDEFNIVINNFRTGEYSPKSKRANIWYFGLDAGLDFNTSPPTAIRGSKIWRKEGTAVISDESGKLLFYTDGETVWTKEHTVMVNGSGLFGESSSTQAALIVPHPGNSNLYYLFTTPAFEQGGPAKGCYYNVIDLSKQNGLGEIITKNVLLFTPTTEKLNAVTHANGEMIWVMAHENATNKFFAYLVTKNGLVETPVVSAVGEIHGDIGGEQFGQLKFTINRKKLGVAIGDTGFEVFDFDASTGKVSNPWYIPSIANGAVGLEFSPSGQFLYCTDYKDNGIHQYDLWAGTYEAFLASHVEFGTNGSFGSSTKEGMQLGPDGRIYVHENTNSTSVSVIDKPDLKGAAANFKLNEINLIGGQGVIRFPNVIASYMEPLLTETIPPTFITDNLCEGSTVTLSISNGVPVSSWNFGDTASAQNTAIGAQSVEHVYVNQGTYSVTMNYLDFCGEPLSNTQALAVYPRPDTEQIDTLLCGSNISLDAKNKGFDYKWFKAENMQTVLGTEQTIYIESEGIYKVELSNIGCRGMSTYDIELETLPSVSLNDNYYICVDESEEVVLNPGTALKKYIWIDDNITNEPLTVNEAGVYTIRLFGDSLCVSDRDILVNDECEAVLHVPNAFTPNADGLNDEAEVIDFYVVKYEITILNEWGEVVFYSEDPDHKWDGIYRNEPAPTGAYAYVVKYTGLEKGQEVKKEKSGSITLIR